MSIPVWARIILRIIIFILLTAATQIGGVVHELAFYTCRKFAVKTYWKRVGVNIAIYLFATYLLVPIIASIWGRERVLMTKNIQPTNYMTVLLNRNYVTPGVNKILARAEAELKDSDIEIRYLDANFPFFDGFPLLPHLSHTDGEKLDLSLIYENREGVIVNSKRSMSGYGVFEEPNNPTDDQTSVCKSKGYFQYDYPKYLTFGEINHDLKFSSKGTKRLVDALLLNSSLDKMFIEPHLKARLKINDKRVKFHGCRAVRHDDHIHIQL